MLLVSQQLICQIHVHNSSPDSSVSFSSFIELRQSLTRDVGRHCRSGRRSHCLLPYRQRHKAPTAARSSPPNPILLKQCRGVKNPIGMGDRAVLLGGVSATANSLWVLCGWLSLIAGTLYFLVETATITLPDEWLPRAARLFWGCARGWAPIYD